MSTPFMSAAGPSGQVYGDGRSLRVGVLSNPRSGGNKKRGRAVSRLLADCPDVMHREAAEPGGIADVLTEFSAGGVELLVINGGDGTVQAVLTILGNHRIFAQPPLLALLCAGTTSMLPRDVGVAGPPVAALQRLLRWAQSTNGELKIETRSIMRIQRDSDALFGMFFGAGAICTGIRAFHSTHNPMGWRGQLMPMLTMARLLLAVFFHSVPPFINAACINGGNQEQRADLFVLTSTLDRLFLGMRPYWGDESGPLRYTAVNCRPRFLLPVLLSLLGLGRSRHATPANGYFSHNADQVQLRMTGDFTLDGELYEAGEQPVTITSAGPALFVC